MKRFSGSSISTRGNRHGAALYIIVLSTSLVVSLLGLAGLAAVRIERRQSQGATDLTSARVNSCSAVEMALNALATNANWRTTYSNGVETTAKSLGADGTGTISWILTDTDGSLTNADTSLRLRGVGRVGSTVQVSSVEIRNDIGPAVLRGREDLSGAVEDHLEKKKWWCQYLKVTLPAQTTGWRVDRVEFYCDGHNEDLVFQVKAYVPASDGRPSATELDSADFTSNGFDGWAWRSFALSPDYWLAATSGICIALQTDASKDPLHLRYRSGGVSESDSALVKGDPSWKSPESDKALLYRVHCTYKTLNGEQKPVMGSWQWDAAP